MLTILRGILWVIGSLAILVALAWFLLPREPVELQARFDASQLRGGVDAYLEASESRVNALQDGVVKQVIWADRPEEKTPLSIVYVHGFSATLQEIRPVPDLVAQALGANLFYTRLAGHGRDGDAMAEPRVADWAQDLAEAMAVGRAIGEQVIVMSTSTGATLSMLGALPGGVAEDAAGLIMVSPNFRVANPAAEILTWPGVRLWGPWVAGAERSWEPANPEHGRFWTTTYPTIATIPMGALVKASQEAEASAISTPVLFMFDPRDQVVSHTETTRIADDWGGPVTIERMQAGPGDDPFFHVIAGDILSPGQTARAAEIMTDWIANLP